MNTLIPPPAVIRVNPCPSVVKPRKNPVSYSDGLAWSGDGHRITRKYDGEFVGGGKWRVAGVEIIGNAERMTPKAGARLTAADKAESGKRKAESAGSTGEFYVLTDVSHLDGTDVSQWTLRQRWAEVKKIFAFRFPLSDFPSSPPAFEASKFPLSAERPCGSHRFPLLLPEEFPDGSALARVIEAGGEGICAHGWDAPFGADFYAAKHLETFRCVVTGFVEGTQSVEISILNLNPNLTLNPPAFEASKNEIKIMSKSMIKSAGKVPLRGNKIDRVRVGSIIKVEGVGLTPAGRIREPRVCSDTPDSWLVAY